MSDKHVSNLSILECKLVSDSYDYWNVLGF